MEDEIYNLLIDLLDKAKKEDRILGIEYKSNPIPIPVDIDNNRNPVPIETDHNEYIEYKACGKLTVDIELKEKPCQSDH